jgi:tyrosyl-tRNA synthetase
MDIDKRIALVQEVGEEILTLDDLKTLFETKQHPIAYDGFEPSGNIHIAQGLLRSINVNKLTCAGINFKFWIADWFALMNNKMGGDIDKIKVTGEYFVEVWKACGMDMDHVEFLWTSDCMDDKDYWKMVIDIARNSTLNRITRCSQIMGRSEKDALSASQIFYPCMQCADIFYLEADIAQLGMDQRKVNMLAREVAPTLGFQKPVAVHHHMLMGLAQPPAGDMETVERAIAMKMSKSNPDTAIFMTDSAEDIKRKFSKAYCPAKQATENPILEYAKYIVFEKMDAIEVKRPEKFGGNKQYESYAQLETDFVAGALHPMDLKAAVGEAINGLLEPVRSHFEKNPKARKLKEQVESFKVTK